MTEIKTAPRPLHTIVRDMADDTETSNWPAEHDALLVVDAQKDFLPGGALGVPHGDEVLAPLNRALRAFERAGRPVYARSLGCAAPA